MIPFAILSCRIERAKKGKTVGREPVFRQIKEVRILELSQEYFTFRLAEEWEPAGPEEEERLVLHFFSFKEGEYKKVILKNGEVRIQKEGEERFFFLYRAVVCSDAWRSCAAALTEEYMRYISLKLDGDEAQLSKALTGYPAESEEIYPETFAQQKEEWFGSLGDKDRTNDLFCGYELGIELDNPRRCKEYLEMPSEEFVSRYWKENCLSEHPLSGKPVKYLYIGNQFCRLLFPNRQLLWALLDQAYRDHMIPVLMFSPIEETRIEETEKLLDELAARCGRENRSLELVLNDWGMASMIRRRGYDCFLLTLGRLLVKQRRDTRMEYKKGFLQHKEELCDGPLQADFYLKYLQEHFGIERISCEACGYPVKLPEGKTSLHLPFFQMNTSSFCPVGAFCQSRDRGRQTPAERCCFECMEHVFLYPKHLFMIGRYNSLFGCDRSVLTDEERLRSYRKQGTDRIVAGFL